MNIFDNNNGIKFTIFWGFYLFFIDYQDNFKEIIKQKHIMLFGSSGCILILLKSTLKKQKLIMFKIKTPDF